MLCQLYHDNHNFDLWNRSVRPLLNDLLPLTMVVKTLSQLCIGAVLSLGGTPYLQACVPMARQYVILLMKTGSSAIVKEYMTLCMMLVLQYFQSDKVNLATSSSNAAFQILQQAVRHQIRHKCGSKKIAPAVAECIIVGLEEIMNSEGSEKRRLRMVLDSATRLFADKVNRNQIQQAKDLSRAWLLLLMTAIDPPKRNGRQSPMLNNLLQAWAAILQREAKADSRTIEELLDEVAQDIRDWCEKDPTSCNNSVKVWIHLLHVSVKEDSQNAASTIISTTLVQGLQRAVGNGHREMIKQALVDCTTSLDQNIKRDDVQSITALFELRKLLHKVARSKARDVDTLLGEAFVSNINGAMGSRGEVVQESPIELQAGAPSSTPELLSPPGIEIYSSQFYELHEDNVISMLDSLVSPARDNWAHSAYELPVAAH